MNRLEDINLPKKESESASEVADASPENIDKREDGPAEREVKALEKEPVSKLKKAFFALTSILVLASGAEAYAQQKAEYFSGAQNEISATTMTLEKVERSSEFRTALVEQGIRVEDAKELVDFVNAKGVPIEDLEATTRNMDKKSDKLMLMKTYSIAYEAVKYNLLDQEHAQSFEKWILTSLKNGDLNVVKKNQKTGVNATYDYKNNTYSDDDIKLSSLEDKSITVHELVHAYQDGAELSQKREEAEFDAYMVQGEYVLRHSGMLEQDKDGNYRMTDMNLGEIKNVHQKLVIAEKALYNAANNRHDLNSGISISGVKMSEVSSADAINFFNSYKEGLAEFSKSVLKIDSDLVNIGTGGSTNLDEFFKKDGLRK